MTYAIQTEGALRTRRAELRQFDHALSAERSRVRHELEQIEAAIPAAPLEPIEVSDHAVVRWLERHDNFDVAAVRRQISDAVLASDTVGRERVVAFDQVQIVVSDNRAVTVLEESQRLRRSANKAHYRPVQSRPLPTTGPQSDPWAKLAALKVVSPLDDRPTFRDRLTVIVGWMRGA